MFFFLFLFFLLNTYDKEVYENCILSHEMLTL